MTDLSKSGSGRRGEGRDTLKGRNAQRPAVHKVRRGVADGQDRADPAGRL